MSSWLAPAPSYAVRSRPPWRAGLPAAPLQHPPWPGQTQRMRRIWLRRSGLFGCGAAGRGAMQHRARASRSGLGDGWWAATPKPGLFYDGQVGNGRLRELVPRRAQHTIDCLKRRRFASGATSNDQQSVDPSRFQVSSLGWQAMSGRLTRCGATSPPLHALPRRLAFSSMLSCPFLTA